ncbi:thioredoxin domain-containing protein [Tamlana agarivorans]|uniref:Thioredoxin domain-containing protein n=2 Tax=Pseudotamlana agarivorans TaxID=481183 RepID=A0ACC5U7D1_9FLAO|nr:thioredoxin domain-containing protein [Tamlana agarivorans]
MLLTLFLCGCSDKKKAASKHKYTNDLINETSPYLLQHAHNPVDWKAWSQETLDLAKKENKLMVISVGYAACHWCHVMEEESFQNDSVAAIMNSKFINIKIDREERPDIDQVYMHAVQLLTGSGGWPLNCIALPDGRPIFGGTYFEKEPWIKILKDLSELYETNPDKAIAYADQLTEGIKESDLITVNRNPSDFQNSVLVDAVDTWKENFDIIDGGEKGAPKFPLPNNLNFLLRYAVQNKDTVVENHVENTLVKMAYGGIYDHIGGGFSRYSVDAKWHIPHFEKMLYDNAQLVSVYSEKYLTHKNKLFKQVVFETLACLERDFFDGKQAFYSALDADSYTEKGALEEGAYYVWGKEALKQHLEGDFEAFKVYYNINETGAWENNNYVLYRNKTHAEVASLTGLTEDELEAKLTTWKQVLLEVRDNRKPPRTDNKALTGWNALTLKAYTDAYRSFQDPNHLKMAVKIGDFIIDIQKQEGGGLNRVYINNESSINAFAEDYALTIQALIGLYEVSLDEKWLTEAKQLMDYTLTHFYDDASGMFYFTSDLDATLITRKMETVDGVLPSSNAVLAHNLFALSLYYHEDTYSEKANQMLHNISNDVLLSPSGYSKWLGLMQNFTKPFYEVAVSGDNAKQKISALQQYYLPNVIYAGARSESELPLLENKYVDNQTYIFVCKKGSCKAPQTEVEKAIQLILTD